MKATLKLAALAAACLLALSACKKSDNDKPASAPASAPTEKSASAPTGSNSVQPAASGEYAVLVIPQTAEQGSKVEVLEFFAYFCPHCKVFDPMLTEWARKNAGKVVFKRVPVAFREDMIPQQRMYYALEAMGKLEGLHEKIFTAVQNERRSLNKEEEILDFVAQHGIDKAQFKEVYNSFSVQSQARNAYNMQGSYKIESVPNIAIDGRYMTSASYAQKRPGAEQSEAGLHVATLQVMDDLVAKVLKERQSGKK